jgi:hypothetical protein
MKGYRLPCICEDALSRPFPLSGARVARMRVGQDDVFRGDGVVARGVVLLPAGDEGYCDHCLPTGGLCGLARGLRFSERLQIAGEPLRTNWGVHLGPRHDGFTVRALRDRFGLTDGYRYRDADFAAPTWAEAMKQAWDWAVGEVLMLEKALEDRRRALEAAECKTCTPHEDPYVERPEEEAVRRLESMNGP